MFYALLLLIQKGYLERELLIRLSIMNEMNNFHILYVIPADLRLVTATVCAVSRLLISLAQPGSAQKEVFGPFNVPGIER